MLARLAAETAVYHADADADIDRFLFKDTTTSSDYRTFLLRLYGFIAPLETAFAMTDGLGELLDLGVRAKSPLVVHDLLALGVTMQDITDLPLCTSIPAFRGPAAALGWMYVVERPMLASAVIRRHLATRLPAEMRGASAYLSSYSGIAGALWRELGESLRRLTLVPGIGDRIVAASGDAFRALNRWRMRDLPRAQAVRYAC